MLVVGPDVVALDVPNSDGAKVAVLAAPQKPVSDAGRAIALTVAVNSVAMPEGLAPPPAPAAKVKLTAARAAALARTDRSLIAALATTPMESIDARGDILAAMSIAPTALATATVRRPTSLISVPETACSTSSTAMAIARSAAASSTEEWPA